MVTAAVVKPFRSGWCGLDARAWQHERCAGAAEGRPCVCDCHQVQPPDLGDVLERFNVAQLVDELGRVASQAGEVPPAVRRLVVAGAELLEVVGRG